MLSGARRGGTHVLNAINESIIDHASSRDGADGAYRCGGIMLLKFTLTAHRLSSFSALHTRHNQT